MIHLDRKIVVRNEDTTFTPVFEQDFEKTAYELASIHNLSVRISKMVDNTYLLLTSIDKGLLIQAIQHSEGLIIKKYNQELATYMANIITESHSLNKNA